MDLLLPVSIRVLFAAALLAFCASAAGAREPAPAFQCPKELDAAAQLLLVASKAMSSPAATLKRFERPSASAPWRPAGGVLPAVVGYHGIRWAWSSGGLHRGGPIKREGDGATPAGIFPIGAPFGFEAAALPGYVRLKAGKQFCVNEPASPSYNTIVGFRPANVSGEDMGSIRLYRRGLFVEYPSNRAERGGSCTFIHVWRRPTAGTGGCVASAEENIAMLQKWVRPKEALIAILPAKEADELEMCLETGRAERASPHE